MTDDIFGLRARLPALGDLQAEEQSADSSVTKLGFEIGVMGRPAIKPSPQQSFMARAILGLPGATNRQSR